MIISSRNNGKQVLHRLAGERGEHQEVFSGGPLTGVVVGSRIRIYLTPCDERDDWVAEMKEAIEEGNSNELWNDWLAFIGESSGWNTTSCADDYGNLSNAPVLVGPDSEAGLNSDLYWQGAFNASFLNYPCGIDGFWYFSPYAIFFEGERLVSKGYVEYEFQPLRPAGTFAYSFADLARYLTETTSVKRVPMNIQMHGGDGLLSDLFEMLALGNDKLADLEADLATRVVWVDGGNEIWVQIVGGNTPHDSVYRKIYSIYGEDWFGREPAFTDHPVLLKIGE